MIESRLVMVEEGSYGIKNGTSQVRDSTSFLFYIFHV